MFDLLAVHNYIGNRRRDKGTLQSNPDLFREGAWRLSPSFLHPLAQLNLAHDFWIRLYPIQQQRFSRCIRLPIYIRDCVNQPSRRPNARLISSQLSSSCISSIAFVASLAAPLKAFSESRSPSVPFRAHDPSLVCILSPRHL